MYSRIELNTTVLFDNQMEHYFPVQFLSRVQPGCQSKRCGRAPLRWFVRSRQPPPELSLTIRAVGSLYFLYLMTSNDYLMFRYCSICTSSKSLLRGLVQRRSVRYEVPARRTDSNGDRRQQVPSQVAAAPAVVSGRLLVQSSGRARPSVFP